MARTISDEELQLKRRARRRLIGAIVLVMAIVVVLPMVLDSEPRPPRQEVSVQIPSPDSGVFTSKVAPLPAAPGSKPAAMATPAEPKMAAVPPPAKEAIKEAPAPKAEPEAAKPATPEPAASPKPATRKPKPAATTATGKFVVQVIALADAEKAKGMQQQIAAAGIKSYTEIVKTAKGDVTRVRAGPFTTRAAAEKAREQLKALGMSGNVITR
jgi:DedD protein